MSGPAGPVTGQWLGEFTNFRGHCMGQWQDQCQDKWQGQWPMAIHIFFSVWTSCDSQWQTSGLTKDRSSCWASGRASGIHKFPGPLSGPMAGPMTVQMAMEGLIAGYFQISAKIYCFHFLTKSLLLLGLFHVFHVPSRPPPSPPINVRDFSSKNTNHPRQPTHLPPLPPSSWPPRRGADPILVYSIPYP